MIHPDRVSDIRICSQACADDETCPIRTIFKTPTPRYSQAESLQNKGRVRISSQNNSSHFINCIRGSGRMSLASESER